MLGSYLDLTRILVGIKPAVQDELTTRLQQDGISDYRVEHTTELTRWIIQRDDTATAGRIASKSDSTADEGRQDEIGGYRDATAARIHGGKRKESFRKEAADAANESVQQREYRILQPIRLCMFRITDARETDRKERHGGPKQSPPAASARGHHSDGKLFGADPG